MFTGLIIKTGVLLISQQWLIQKDYNFLNYYTELKLCTGTTEIGGIIMYSVYACCPWVFVTGLHTQDTWVCLCPRYIVWLYGMMVSAIKSHNDTVCTMLWFPSTTHVRRHWCHSHNARAA